MLALETPCERLAAAFIEMAMEFKAQGNARYVAAAEDFAGFLSRQRAEAAGQGLPPGRVPSLQFWLVQGDRILGCSRLRPDLTPELEQEGGNIGYDIRPSARRKGFGTILLRLTLERAAARGLARVRITCDADNIGSIRVIEKNGGILAGEIPSPDRATMIRQYWISTMPAREMNAMPIVPGVSMVALHGGDQARLAEFCRRCTEFFELVEGEPGGAATAAEILGPLPARITSGVKRVFGVERSGELIGLVELLDGFPGPKNWYVGLLVLLPELRRGGLGTDVWLGLRDWIQAQEAAVVRLIVQKQNPAARTFWERQGFTIEEETTVKVGALESPVWRMSLRFSADGIA